MKKRVRPDVIKARLHLWRGTSPYNIWLVFRNGVTYHDVTRAWEEYAVKHGSPDWNDMVPPGCGMNGYSRRNPLVPRHEWWDLEIPRKVWRKFREAR